MAEDESVEEVLKNTLAPTPEAIEAYRKEMSTWTASDRARQLAGAKRTFDVLVAGMTDAVEFYKAGDDPAFTLSVSAMLLRIMVCLKAVENLSKPRPTKTQGDN